jgi:crotonobetainyl-CoA:carnitine CoA-transferase CaiB-like acyl-CoA transferase
MTPAGDTMRYITPGQFWKDGSLGFQPDNHNKYNVALDVHHTAGQAVFKRLVAHSDVVVENLKPGALEAKVGLGYRQLLEVNPALIYVTKSRRGRFAPRLHGCCCSARSGLTRTCYFAKRGGWLLDRST